MKIGYARVSTDDQDLGCQVSVLQKSGCEHVYQEKRSGKTADRPELKKMLAKMRPRDVIVVTKLDRLARSTADLLALLAQIADAQAALVSLAEPWADTSSPAGTLIVTVMAGIAQFERERMLERCNEGRRMAKARGVSLGRKPALSGERRYAAVQMLRDGSSAKELATVFGVNLSTIYRLMRAQ